MEKNVRCACEVIKVLRLPLRRPPAIDYYHRTAVGPQPCQSTVKAWPRLLSAYLILEAAAGTPRPGLKDRLALV